LSKNLKEAVGCNHSGSRRRFLSLCAGAFALAASSVSRPTFAKPALITPERSLSFYNLHTGESLKTAYWADGKYIPEAMSEINFLLRDFRNGEIKPINPELLDTLHLLTRRLNTSSPIHLVSGYRSPSTNAQLHARSSGVARHSLHMEGMAADIRIPGRDLKKLFNVARIVRAGGVGYYPKSDFVHVDVGRIRHWTGA